MEVAVYTCSTPGYDAPRSDGVLEIEPPGLMSDPMRDSRLPKILPHLFLPPHDWSVWVDGNAGLEVEPGELVEMMLHPDVAVARHPRQPLRSEFKAVVDRGLVERGDAGRHMAALERRTLPEAPVLDSTLYACTVVLRRNDPHVNAFNERWWALYCAGARRDQLSFPEAYWEADLQEMGTYTPTGNRYFWRRPHKNTKGREL